MRKRGTVWDQVHDVQSIEWVSLFKIFVIRAGQRVLCRRRGVTFRVAFVFEHS